MAHAPASGAAAVRGRRPRGRPDAAQLAGGARRSLGAREGKAADKRTPDGLPVHSLTTLLADLGTLTLNHASLPGRPDSRFLLASEPTELQERAFELLGMDPDRDDCISATA